MSAARGFLAYLCLLAAALALGSALGAYAGRAASAASSLEP